MLEFIRSSYFQDLLNSLSIGIVIFNAEGTVYAINHSASSLFGFPPDKYVGNVWTQLLHGFDDEARIQAMGRIVVARRTAPGRITTRYVKPNGQILHITVSASPLMYYGKLFGIVLEINDITDLYLSHTRERRMLEERSRMQQERYESLQKLSMSVAHQIRNPVMTIGGMARLLARSCSPSSRQVELFDAIIASMLRLEAIVKEVYEYGSLVIKDLRRSGVDELVDDAIKMASQRKHDLSAKATWLVDLAPCHLSVDPPLFSRALCEILINALEALSQNGQISIKGVADETTYRIEVSDNGCGIQESDLQFIFDPFFTRKTLGVGMGLCKVQRIVQEHGGRMQIESTPGKGTVVSLVFNLDK